MIDIVKNATGHFRTITRHRHEVVKNCFRAGIPFQGLLHDLSKYTPTEFIPGVLNYQGTRSPNEAERESYGYSKAWLHHKGRNRHHYEYWTDYNPKTKKLDAVEMPVNYFVEMVCDRIAASKIYNGADYKDSDPIEYFHRGMKNRMINERTAKQLDYVLTMLANEGEEKTFRYLRRLIRKYKHNRII